MYKCQYLNLFDFYSEYQHNYSLLVSEPNVHTSAHTDVTVLLTTHAGYMHIIKATADWPFDMSDFE